MVASTARESATPAESIGWGAFGFTPTETYTLGDFKLVDTADVEMLKAAAKAAKTGAKE
jgi:hypothetical protein